MGLGRFRASGGDYKLQAYKDTVQQLQSMQIRSEVYSMMHTPKISTIHKTHAKQAHAPKNTAANPIHDQQRHTPKAGTTHIATQTTLTYVSSAAVMSHGAGTPSAQLTGICLPITPFLGRSR